MLDTKRKGRVTEEIFEQLRTTSSATRACGTAARDGPPGNVHGRHQRLIAGRLAWMRGNQLLLRVHAQRVLGAVLDFHLPPNQRRRH
jgi:hypothetical protein